MVDDGSNWKTCCSNGCRFTHGALRTGSIGRSVRRWVANATTPEQSRYWRSEAGVPSLVRLAEGGCVAGYDRDAWTDFVKRAEPGRDVGDFMRRELIRAGEALTSGGASCTSETACGAEGQGFPDLLMISGLRSARISSSRCMPSVTTRQHRLLA